MVIVLKLFVLSKHDAKIQHFFKLTNILPTFFRYTSKITSVGEEVPDPSAPQEMHPNNRYDTTDYKGVWLLCRLWGRLSLQVREDFVNFLGIRRKSP